MAKSTVAIFNQALAWLGGEQLSSVEAPWEDSTLGRLCQNNFPPVLDNCLSAHAWSFAIARQALARKPEETPHPAYGFRYGLPADCLRPLEALGEAGTSAPYILEGGDILTVICPATLTYVARKDDPRAWPPEFDLALSWGLAAVLATAKNNDRQVREDCARRFEAALAEAVARDHNKQRPRRPASAWLTALGADGGERNGSWRF